MHDRFGSPGFLAAYNAGPGRYEEHLSRGRALPAETRAYLAQLRPIIGNAPADRIPVTAVAPEASRSDGLFMRRMAQARPQ
jgi:soluble lytic murein transglycosylase-like protein